MTGYSRIAAFVVFAAACSAFAVARVQGRDQETPRVRTGAAPAHPFKLAQGDGIVVAPALEGQVRTATIVLPFSTKPRTVKYEIRRGRAIMEEDIVLGRVDASGNIVPAKRRADRSANAPPGFGTTTQGLTVVSGNYWRWRNGVIPYFISPGVNAAMRQRVIDAAAKIDSETNLSFVQMNNTSEYEDYIDVVVTTEEGVCGSSLIGMQGGRQELEVNQEFVEGTTRLRCAQGSIEHEFLHAAGVYHEQSREDRDNFVRIETANIRRNKESNFDNKSETGDDIGPYDFGSIMHYRLTSMGIRDVPPDNSPRQTIFILNPAAPYDVAGRTCVNMNNIPNPTVSDVVGQRACLSAGDIAGVNRIYPFDSILARGENWGSDAYATRIAFGDIDGDGRKEIAVAVQGKTGQPRVLVLDDEKERFRTLWEFGADWKDDEYATSVAFGSTGRNSAEVLGIARRANSGARAWVVNRTGNGEFQTKPLNRTSAWGPNTYATDVAFGDIDGDGRDEIAVTRKAGANERFLVFDDAGDRHALIASGGQEWGGESFATAAAFGDIDADGREELGIARTSNVNARYFIFSYVDAPALKERHSGGSDWGSSDYASAVAFGQIDADPAKEFAVARGSIAILQPKSEAPRYYVFDDSGNQYRRLLVGGVGWGAGTFATGIAFGNIDRDVRQEMAITRRTQKNERFWILDDAQKGFKELYAAGNRWNNSTYATSIAFGDVDGDTCSEVGYTRKTRENMRFRVLRNLSCVPRLIVPPVGGTGGAVVAPPVAPPDSPGSVPPVVPRSQ